MTNPSVRPASTPAGSRASAAFADNTPGKGRVRMSKRTLTSENLLRTVGKCAIAMPVILRSIFRPKTSRAMREKVMLGVTAINDCRFCAWGHSHWAISQGVPMEEVKQILGSMHDSLATSDPGEAAAILFGQHYAEHLDRIDPDAVLNLHHHFSEAQVREIVAYVYFITFTNLSGNTVDVVLERLRGEGRPSPSWRESLGSCSPRSCSCCSRWSSWERSWERTRGERSAAAPGDLPGAGG